MDHTLVVKKLKVLLQDIPLIERKGAQFYDTPEFRNWRAEILKWLALGEGYTRAERLRFLNLRHWYFLEHGSFESDGPEVEYASALVEVSACYDQQSRI